MFPASRKMIEEVEEKSQRLDAGALLLYASRIGDTLFAESESAKKEVLERALLAVEDDRFAPAIREHIGDLFSEYTSVVLIAQRVVDAVFPELKRVREKTIRGIRLTQADEERLKALYPLSSSWVQELSEFLDGKVKERFQEIESASEELERKVEKIMESHPEAEKMASMIDNLAGDF